MKLREQNAKQYWSGLYKSIWNVIKQETACYRKELEYRLEEKGYPPIDVLQTVKWFVKQKTFIRIDVPYNNNKLVFYTSSEFYKKQYTKVMSIIKEKKSTFLKYRKLNDTLKGQALIDAVVNASNSESCQYTVTGVQVKWFNGKKVDTGDVDVVIFVPQTSIFWGAECKNTSEIIDLEFVARKNMLNLFINTRKLGIQPLFIVSRVFNNVKKLLVQLGAIVIETEVVFFVNDFWDTAKKLKNTLGYYFVRRCSHPKTIKVLCNKMSILKTIPKHKHTSSQYEKFCALYELIQKVGHKIGKKHKNDFCTALIKLILMYLKDDKEFYASKEERDLTNFLDNEIKKVKDYLMLVREEEKAICLRKIKDTMEEIITITKRN